ncbi:MAG: hypothetical protein HZB64_11480 [Rhodocyclales bacterium]|nr:hypothetical protein [Rhodocyclales bacterium]
MRKSTNFDGLIFSPPKSKRNDPQDREPYFLAGPEDFHEYIERLGSGSLSDVEADEFHLRIIIRFCEQVFNKEKVDAIVLNELANQLWKVIQGGAMGR